MLDPERRRRKLCGDFCGLIERSQRGQERRFASLGDKILPLFRAYLGIAESYEGLVQSSAHVPDRDAA